MVSPEKNLPGQADGKSPIRVLVVDDSAFMRFTISKHLGEAGGIQVVGAARDGQEALELIPKLQPDIITLDVEMPRLDGLSTLRVIMADFPRPVIMLSSLTTEGALETVQALTLGAVDFVSKPTNKANVSLVLDELVGKVRRSVSAHIPQPIPRLRTASAEVPVRSGGVKNSRSLSSADRVVVIGSSTGGPRALTTVVPELSSKLQAAIVIVQHMPVGFTRSLAERLDSMSQIKVKEAEPGDRLEVGRALLAPGGFHMTLNDNFQIALNQNPTVHGVRPAIDVTMSSIAMKYGASVIGVVLTGMGSDGTTGCTLINKSGGYVIAEDESTCVVWGMPRSVFEAGVANEILPLQEVARGIERAVAAGSPRKTGG